MIGAPRWARHGAVAAAAIAALVLLPAASAATAAPSNDGFWYFDLLNVQAAHDAGFTGAGVTIAIFDGQIDTTSPTLLGADITVHDKHCFDEQGNPYAADTTDPIGSYHGTNIVSYVVGTGVGYPGQTGVKGIAPGASIEFYSLGGPVEGKDASVLCTNEDGDDRHDFAPQIYDAIEQGVDIMSFSVIGPPSPAEGVAFAHAMNAGIIVVAGIANTELQATDPDIGEYPGSANGVISVQAMDSSGAIQNDAASGKPRLSTRTDVVAPGVNVMGQGDGRTNSTEQLVNSGTSIATPIVASFLAVTKQKYPEATNNQLIQSLINNTSTQDHELIYDATFTYGYGIASLTHLLAVDPTSYDDVNPLVEDTDVLPTPAMIADPPDYEDYIAALDAAGEPTPSPVADAPAADSAGWLLPVLLGGAVLLLVVLGAVALVIVLAVRRKKD